MRFIIRLNWSLQWYIFALYLYFQQMCKGYVLCKVSRFSERRSITGILLPRLLLPWPRPLPLYCLVRERESVSVTVGCLKQECAHRRACSRCTPGACDCAELLVSPSGHCLRSQLTWVTDWLTDQVTDRITDIACALMADWKHKCTNSKPLILAKHFYGVLRFNNWIIHTFRLWKSEKTGKFFRLFSLFCMIVYNNITGYV